MHCLSIILFASAVRGFATSVLKKIPMPVLPHLAHNLLLKGLKQIIFLWIYIIISEILLFPTSDFQLIRENSKFSGLYLGSSK